MTQFRFAPGARLSARLIGADHEPLLHAEAAFANPDELVELAATAIFSPAFGPAGGYPGLRAALPNEYIQAVVNVLTRPLAEAFALGPIRPISAQGAFSIVTLPENALAAPQRAPHVDSVNPMQFAILHYLCDSSFGGTAFYRHRATGFEKLNESRLPGYNAIRSAEGAPTGYVGDGSPWFEQIGQVSAAMNRLVAYRSCVLHSGQIPSPELLTENPRHGRLTANVFVTFAPA
ncbi:DUF6445 family protein [Sphingomonas aerophila]|uniref:Uncharacterized protein n=1 Tax=Sphingomonas aerophila TaxID=1344948 RepID=A0A7W9BDL1_9SPHN|nr:DUF6445 family protein [Sphingomonas aerophila]MBB5715202.1 hypothetical protein [Sphingomonas aerophila]